MSPRRIPLSGLRERLAEFLEVVSRKDDRLIITIRGKDTAVILSLAEYERFAKQATEKGRSDDAGDE